MRADFTKRAPAPARFGAPLEPFRPGIMRRTLLQPSAGDLQHGARDETGLLGAEVRDGVRDVPRSLGTRDHEFLPRFRFGGVDGHLVCRLLLEKKKDGCYPACPVLNS